MEGSKLKIKLLIDNQLHELTIDRSQEEVVREAAKRLNQELFTYKRQLKTNDPIAPLRLVALQFASLAVEAEFRERDSSLSVEMRDVEESLMRFLDKKE